MSDTVNPAAVGAILASDHVALDDPFAARRYFDKFGRITTHLARVAARMQSDGFLDKGDVAILSDYVTAIDATFKTLSMKYLISTGAGTGLAMGGVAGASLTFDNLESGFPVHRELLSMATDALQADKHLRTMRSVAALKEDMVQEILTDLRVPVRLQFALSQRLYYESLVSNDLFWAQNDPQLLWQGDVAATEGRRARRKYMIHWAIYDSQVNLPIIYLMEVEDSGRESLARDQRRWPEVQRHLMAQSLAGLKLLTVASGFDRDFDDLHPKRLRRIHLGPMYSSAFTQQNGPLKEVLTSAQGAMGDDWALAFSIEELWADRVEDEKKGWFGSVERQVFAVDPFSALGVDMGLTKLERALIMPERPYQVLAELDPPGFRNMRKFVVAPGGQVMSSR